MESPLQPDPKLEPVRNYDMIIIFAVPVAVAIFLLLTLLFGLGAALNLATISAVIATLYAFVRWIG
jgi:hypothetical protein